MNNPDSKITPKRHLNTYIHKIINYIRTQQEPVTFLEIKNELGINLISNPPLLQILKRNPRVEIVGSALIFKTIYNVGSVEELEKLMRNATTGILYSDLLESNKNIREWIDELGPKILILKDTDESEILFWNSLTLEKAPAEVLHLFHSIKVPNYTDIVKELSDAGLKTQRREVIKKPVLKLQSKKYKRKTKITNVHIKDLNLEGDDEE